MRSSIRLAAFAAIPVLALAACSAEEAGDAVEQGIETGQEVAGEAAEAASEAASEAADAAGEAVDTAQFCKAAYDVSEAIEDEDFDRAIEAGETLVAEAPEEVRPQAQTVLDGAKRYAGGDRSAAADPEFRQAAEEVETYARDACDPTE